MKIYTKTGDTGDTGLFDGQRVPKDDRRIDAYGTVDELNALLGLASAQSPHPPLRALLQTLQHQLFNLGADLATPANSPNAPKIQRLGDPAIRFLENQIDTATALLPPLHRFVLPGGTLTASHLHLARTVCRRAERLLVTLMRHEPLPLPLIYLNRLSDLLFTLARWANQLEGLPDVEWIPEKSPQ